MRTNRYYMIVLALIMGFLSNFAVAQVTQYPFFTGFEDAADNTSWVMVGDPTNTSMSWTIGTANAGKKTGSYGLYVTNDGGTTPAYTATQSSVIMAYREFTLAAGVHYSVAFDFKGRGDNQKNDFLTVCVVDNPTVAITPSGTVPAWVNTYKKLDTVRNSMVWTNKGFEVVGTGATVKLVFIWRNDNANGTNPGACIDNLYIRQTSDLDYFCDFDDPAENNNWVINNNTGCVNKWVIGSAICQSPRNSLYISADNGTNNEYTNNSGWVTAYREFTLPAGVTCDVTFDWNCFGDKDYDFLMCCWVSDTTINIGSNTNTSLPAWANANAKTFNGEKNLAGQMAWKHESFQVVGKGSPEKLVFLWMNNANTVRNPPAAIDNIQITRRDCPAPINLTATSGGGQIVVTWQGQSTTYDIWYRNSYTNSAWVKNNNYAGQVGNNTYTINGLGKGRYDIWVRAHCDDNEVSIWSETLNHLIVTGDGCLNYTALSDPQVCTCTYGSFSNPYQQTGVIDNGYAAPTSRHTVHYIPEVDPRTGGGLRTVPLGELASVRLGNWETGAEAESITYTLAVDSASSILLLRYAVILEDPDHNASNQPRMKIEILNQNNQLIDAACGSADFIPGQNTQDWNVESSGTYNVVRWKDWTLMGMNLQQFIGQNVKVRLTNYDCSQSGHYGYGYFLLNCASAEVKGLSCGAEAIDEVEAPQGFDYAWYRRYDLTQTVVSTDRIFIPAAGDTCSYVCRVSYKDLPNCGYNIYISLAPRWPLAQCTTQHTPADCKNYITFTNTSTVKDINGNLTGQICDEYYWDFGNGQTSTDENPVVEFPDAGGTYTVRLIAGMTLGDCKDTTEFQLVVPAIASTTDLTKKTICQGQRYVWRGETFTETTYRVDTVPMQIGCDSLLILDLTVSENDTIEIRDTICEQETYNFNGQSYSQTGDYTVTLTNAAGCDSICNLHLIVNPGTGGNVSQTGLICADDSAFKIIYNDNGSVEATNYRVEFSQPALNTGFLPVNGILTRPFELPITLPQVCKPGIYDATLVVWDSVYNCGETQIPFQFTVSFPDTIVIQKFDNVLAVKNKDYNGGFDVREFQWFVNGSPIPGAIGAYYYLGEGESFNPGDVYTVLVTLADGTKLSTCPITPVPAKPTITAFPTVISSGRPIKITVPSVGEAKLWTLTGILLKSAPVRSGENTFEVPAKEGYYLLDVITEAGDKGTFRVMVKK